MSEPALVVENLGFTFAGRETPTLENISLAIEPGSWTVLAGRSGSGKSTLLRAMAGLIPHHSAGQMQGRVRLFGRDTRQASPAELAGLVGLVLQSPDDQICTTTLGAEIAFGLENLALPPEEIASRVGESLTALGMSGRERRSVQRLSGGQKQRLLLAAIMAMRPRLLLLDEPLSQLDAAAAADLLAELARMREAGLAIVLAEHRFDDVLACADRVLVLGDGKLVDDVPANQPALVCERLSAAGLPPPEVAQLALAAGKPVTFNVEALLCELGPRRAAKVEPGPVRLGSPNDRPLLASAYGMCFRYPRATEDAMPELSFDLHAGERVAIVGPNGAGKSTLLALLAGLLRPTEGQLDFAAHDEAHPPCGLMLQNPDLTLFCGTVREELAFGPWQSGLDEQAVAQRVAEVAADLELTALLDEPPLALSQGQRLRTAVGALLTLEPRLLLLDEPTTGQDQGVVARLLAAMAASVEGSAKRSLVFSTHDLRSVLRYSDRVLVLGDGKLLADCEPCGLFDGENKLLALADLRPPPLVEVRRRLGLAGDTIAELAEELRK